MTRQRLVLGAGITSLVVAAATLIPSVSFAQTAEEPPAEAEAYCESGFGTLGIGGPRLGGLGHGEELATALGITVEELQAANAAARESVAGTLGEDAERDEIHEAHRTAFAAELGITVEALEAAQQTVQDAKQAAAIANVEAKVADGTLTQERADEIIAAIESGERFPGGPPRLPDGGSFRRSRF